MCSFHIPVMQREVVESLGAVREASMLMGPWEEEDMPARFFDIAHQTAY